MALLTFVIALSISAVAAYYSIIGLAKIFAAAFLPIVIMGSVLEVGKIVTAVWLHRHWDVAPKLLKSYLTFAVVVLMLITSMGIFGFLSSAHIEQTAEADENIAKIEQIDRKLVRLNEVITTSEATIDKIENRDVNKNSEINEQIATEESRIDKVREKYQNLVDEQNEIINSANSNLDLLEEYVRDDDIRSLQSLVGTVPDGNYGPQTAKKVSEYREREEERVDRVLDTARAKITELREQENQQLQKSQDLIDRLRERITSDDLSETDTTRLQRLQTTIIETEDQITELNSEKFELESSYRKLEAEVGPLKYIAEMIYGTEADTDVLENAVRWVIIAIIFVFDPLAILLVIAAQTTYMIHQKHRKEVEQATQLSGAMLKTADDVLVKTKVGWKKITNPKGNTET